MNNKMFKQNETKSHSRMSLSGISTLLSKQQDPRLQTSGMARGFTLIELLVVVLIIGILAAVALPAYQRAVAKSRFVQLQLAAESIVTAQKLYKLENDSFASDLDSLPVSYSKTTDKLFNLNSYTKCSIGPSFVTCFLEIPNISYFRYYDRTWTQCCAYRDDDFRGEWLCKDVIGVTTWSSNCGQDEQGAEQCRCFFKS